MDKKLEARIARLEKALSRKSVKNEDLSELRSLQSAFEQINDILDNLDPNAGENDSRLSSVLYKLRSNATLGERIIKVLLAEEMANTDNF